MTISRRGFLGGLAAGTLAAGTAAASAGVKKLPGWPDSYGLLHDTNLCVGCRRCEEACKRVNGLPEPAVPLGDESVFDKMRRTSKDDYTVVNRYRRADGGRPAVYRKHQCMHCQDPCCASVCFVQAFEKTPQGPVLYHPERCVGCRYCVMACPYYALAYEYEQVWTPRVVRCTMCYPRIKKGQQPGCAEACPMGAITFGRRSDLLKLARQRIRKQPDRYIDHIYGEHEFGGTSWLTIGGTPFGELGLHEGAVPTPLPEIGSSYLSVVPLVITIYPGLLAGFYAFSRRREQLSRKETREAVAAALERARQEAENKLQAAAEKAKKEKEKAVAQAVKKAVEEAKKQAGQTGQEA